MLGTGPVGVQPLTVGVPTQEGVIVGSVGQAAGLANVTGQRGALIAARGRADGHTLIFAEAIPRSVAVKGIATGVTTVTGVAAATAWPPPAQGQCVAAYQPFVCPDATNIVKLWPRGRAWPITHDPSTYERYLDWIAQFPRGTIPDTKSWPAGFVMAGFTKVIIDVFQYLVDRLCALREEFWCATQIETRDVWMAEYGLPDACDPFPDLCTKVAALGGQTCAYFQQVAGWAGWGIDCVDNAPVCGFMAGCTYTGVGSRAGGVKGTSIQIIVSVPDSPAYHVYKNQVAYAGCLMAGHILGCSELNIVPLQCLMERIAPAHVVINYEIAA